MNYRRNNNKKNENPKARRELAWHALPEEEIFQKLCAESDGLDGAQVEERLREYGPNILPGRKPPTVLAVILHQFFSPLIYILLIAGSVSLAIGDLKDGLFIFVVIMLNAAMGTVQEWKAEQSAHALQSILDIMARVRRDGEIHAIPAEEVVPGDVIMIESGDKVPADIRLLKTSNLTIDESFLTGESFPVDKNEKLLPEESPVSVRSNMAFAGATVTAGRGMGMAVATGSHTEVGQIASTL